MKPRQYSSEAIVISRKNTGEADKVLTVLAKNYGKLVLIAKGVRKPKSRKRGHLEIFSRIKFSAVETKGIDLVTEAELLDEFPVIRRNLHKMSLAYYYCEVTDKILRGGLKHDDVYQLLCDSLEALEKAGDLKVQRINFIRKLLIILGYWSEGKRLADADAYLEEILERQLTSPIVGKKMLKKPLVPD